MPSNRVIGAFAPGFDVASDQVRRIVHKRDPAGPFDVRHPFLEEALAHSGLDQGRARGGGQIRVGDSTLLDILPFLDAGKLTFDEETGRVMQYVTAEDGLSGPANPRRTSARSVEIVVRYTCCKPSPVSRSGE